MVLSNGTKRARNVSSLVNSTDRCGGERKRGMPAFSMYYPRIPKGVACNRGGCSADTACGAASVTQVKYSRGSRGGTRLG
jgi:hypothetical protein